MALSTVILIALGLAMDSVAVCFTCGAIHRKIKPWIFLLTSFMMGLFQGSLTAIGYFLGATFRDKIEAWDHWIAFLLLIVIGLKMIYEYFSHENKKVFCPSSFKVIIGLSVATSIDALAIGIGISMLIPSPLEVSIIIGLVSFILSLVALFLGARISKRRNWPFEFIGGLILVIIAVKILLHHLSNAI